MYSPLYCYFYLRSDDKLSEKKSIDDMKDFLSRLEEIIESDSVNYKNRELFPWMSLTLIDANSYESWRVKESIKEVNLISIVGSKEQADSLELNRQKYIELMKKIADFLSWEIIEEETEEGLEDFMVYKPVK